VLCQRKTPYQLLQLLGKARQFAAGAGGLLSTGTGLYCYITNIKYFLVYLISYCSLLPGSLC
jgi:hypothetical protein